MSSNTAWVMTGFVEGQNPAQHYREATRAGRIARAFRAPDTEVA